MAHSMFCQSACTWQHDIALTWPLDLSLVSQGKTSTEGGTIALIPIDTLSQLF